MQRYWKLAAAITAIAAIAPYAASAQGPGKREANSPPRRASGPASPSPRLGALGGHPNLNGLWQVLNGADWDLRPHSAAPARVSPEELGALGAEPPSLGVLVGDTDIPYKAEARAQYEKNRMGAPKADPEAACDLPGIPRATYIDHPFQIIQGASGDIMMVYQYATANRLIQMKKVEIPPIDTWMGASYGEWEGKTLKVVTLSQNGMTWLDRQGDYLSPNATVTEHFTLKDADHMQYEVKIEDPTVFTRPWTISMVLYRHVEPNAQLLDFRCVPFAELLVYGDLLKTKPAATPR